VVAISGLFGVSSFHVASCAVQAVDLGQEAGAGRAWQLVDNIAVLQQEQGQLDAARASHEEAGGAEFWWKACAL